MSTTIQFSDEIRRLITEAQHESVVFRNVAIKQLMNMNTRESAHALFMVLDDIQSLYVFRVVVPYLDVMGVLEPLPYLRGMLMGQMSRKGHNPHLIALETLRNYHDHPDTLDILAEFLFSPPQHTHGRNRTTAAVQIGLIGTEEALYILGQVLANQGDLPARRSAINGLVKTRNPRAQQMMLRIMDDLLEYRAEAESETFGIVSDMASGIHQLMIRGIEPEETAYAVQVLARWLYILPYRMTGNISNVLHLLNSPIAREAQETWLAWRKIATSDKSVDNVSIFR